MTNGGIHMKQYIKSPNGIITIIIALLTIVASIAITYTFRATKEITVSRETSVQIVTRTDSGIRFLYGDIELEGAFLTTVTIANTGDFEVVEDDFREPLRVLFDDNIQIYDVLIREDTAGLVSEAVAGIGNHLVIDNFF